MVTIKGNGIVKTMFVSKHLNGNIKEPQMILNYNFMEGVKDEEEILFFFTRLIFHWDDYPP
jgi:hypothetical protein